MILLDSSRSLTPDSDPAALRYIILLHHTNAMFPGCSLPYSIDCQTPDIFRQVLMKCKSALIAP